jgi:peptide deformylase
LNFVAYPDPRLNARAEPRDQVDEALRETGRKLLATALETSAFGLAAAHIGEVAPVVVISGEGEPRTYTVLFNPRIVAVADKTASGEEGSVSLPGVRILVERPLWAEIAYMDGDGVGQQATFEGFLARVALHEIEQMQGTFFLDRVSRLKREMALKKAKKHAG